MQLAKAPIDGLQVLQEGLARIYHRPDIGGADSLAAAVVFPQAMQPIPVYTIGLDDLAAGCGIDAVRFIGWQYLLLSGSNVVRAAHIYPIEKNSSQLRFGSVTNAFVEGTVQAIAVAEALDRVKDPFESFELRSLRLPPLFVSSLWLKSVNGLDDLFVVVPPAPQSLRPLGEYDAKQIFAALQAAAQKRMGLGHATSPAIGAIAPTGPIILPGPATS